MLQPMLPTLLYILSGPVYEYKHHAVTNPTNKTYTVDIRETWHSHQNVIAILRLKYNVSTAAITYTCPKQVQQWLSDNLNAYAIVRKKYSTQVITRAYGLLKFSSLFNSAYYFITRVDIIYSTMFTYSLNAFFVPMNSIVGLNMLVGNIINDVMYIFHESNIQRFIHCSLQQHPDQNKHSSYIPLHSHFLHTCMNTTTIFGKQYTNVRDKNNLYNIPGHYTTTKITIKMLSYLKDMLCI